jgi:flagellar biosynthesis/type III secretory pathway ATPase
LVEADDPNEPISDALRGLLDGHVWLSRRLASRGQYPAVAVLESISRLMPDVAGPGHRQAAAVIRDLMAVYREHEDVISIGAYRAGSNPKLDAAIQMQDRINDYLRQDVSQCSTLESARLALVALSREASERLERTIAA